MISYIRAALSFFKRAILALAFAGKPPSPKDEKKMAQEWRRKIRAARAQRPLILKIEQAKRNAVALGFRKYHRLSAKRPALRLAA